jgi:hypothetical protein
LILDLFVLIMQKDAKEGRKEGDLYVLLHVDPDEYMSG